MITLEAYRPETWFSLEGARIKKRRMHLAGVPDMRDWRFITLTIGLRSLTPREAYELGKDRMRRFLARLRKAFGRTFRWCWKLEVHHDEDGYPHWHLLVDYRKKIPVELFERIAEWWGLGRIDIRRVESKDWEYVFKYVSKGLEDLPEWVVRYKGRIRIFQTCAGFYTKRRKREAKKQEPRTCMARVDLITRENWNARKAAIVTTSSDGLRRVRVVKLRFTFLRALLLAAHEAIQRGVPLVAPNVVQIHEHQVIELLNEHRKYQGLGACPNHCHRSFAAAA